MANENLYGFHRLEDVYEDRVTEVGVDVVNEAIGQAVQWHNDLTEDVMSLFAEVTTTHKKRYNLPGFSRLQPLDEDGRARKIREGAYYDIALPLRSAGVAWGANFVTRVKMTVAEAARATNTLLVADRVWLRDQAFAALFTNTNQTFEDEEFGTLTVKPIANGDTDQYYIVNGASPLVTDNHFFAQANSIADSADNPFPTIKDDLDEHPENAGDIVHFVASNLVSDISALTLFYPVRDSNIQYGANTDQLAEELGGSYPGELKGYVDDGGYIVEWPALPSSYMVSVAQNGPRPLAMREHPESELRGFRQVATREDHPFWESQYQRWAGFGGWNRIGAVVSYIGNANYQIPSNYSAPIA